MMDTRKQQLLKLVIENHIATAEPIGSKFLVAEGKIDWSEATVRNELRSLEEEGYLTHPHTSAGRLPTEKGYRYFVDNIDKTHIKISKKDNATIESAAKKDQKDEIYQKTLARTLADVSEESVILAFSRDRVYYTGLSNLFNKPELAELKMVADVSGMFDHCEECIGDFFNDVGDEPKIFIGSEHSFGNMLSIVAFKFNENNLMALMGLQRMNYKKNLFLMNKIKEII